MDQQKQKVEEKSSSTVKSASIEQEVEEQCRKLTKLVVEDQVEDGKVGPEETDTAAGEEEDTAENEEEIEPSKLQLTSLFSEAYRLLPEEQLREVSKQKMSVLEVDDDSVADIELKTMGQSINPVWKEARVGRLTASGFSAFAPNKPLRLSEQQVRKAIYGGDFVQTAAMLHGVRNEEKARTAFEAVFSKEHVGLQVKPAGLVVSKECPLIGASPDGYVECLCAECREKYGSGGLRAVLEIKCPYSLRDSQPTLAPYLTLKDGNGKYTLNKSHPYFSQIQGQMKVCDLSVCFFVVWTPLGLHFHEEALDSDFCDKLFLNLTRVCWDFLMPELLTRRMDPSLDTPCTSLNVCCSDGSFQKVVACGNRECTISYYHVACVFKSSSVPRNLREWFCDACSREF